MGGEQPEWFWDRGHYDDVGRRLVPLSERLVETIDRRAGGLAGRTVVDLACGTGNAAIDAARRGARVTGVDLGAGLLTIAGETAGAVDLDVDWVLADVTATGLETGSYDAALSSVGLIFVEDRAGAIAEVARLVRSGGWFGYTAWVDDPGSPFFTPFAQVLAPEPPADSPESSPAQWAEADIARAELAGEFTDLEIDQQVCEWRFADVDEVLHMVHTSPRHLAVTEHLSVEDRDRLDAAFADTFGALRGPDGMLTYASPYVVVSARRR